MDFLMGFVSGGLFCGGLVYKITRARGRQQLEMVKQGIVSGVLEMQKDINDSGRTDEVRENAGPAGDESNLFELHPGVLVRQHIANARKSAEGVDTQPNSDTIEDRSNSDREK